MRPLYVTRENVKAAAGFSGSEENAHVDRLLGAVSDEVDRVLHRHFYPLTAAYYFSWPNPQQNTVLKLYLDDDLLALTTLTAGGTTIAAADYFLENNRYGPPYRRIEIDLSSSASFKAGDTGQQAIVATGRWGYSEVSAAAGALAEADDGTETALDVTDSSLIGVGDLILIGTERLIVTDKNLLTTTATATGVAAEDSVVTIVASNGALVKAGEVITIDSERFLVESISGNNLTTRRAYDGSTLAAHSNAAVIYAPRTLTVERAAVGTVAAAHDTATAITKNVPPGLISELCLAEVLYARAQEKGHMTLSIGQGEGAFEVSGKGIKDIRARAEAAYARGRGLRAI